MAQKVHKTNGHFSKVKLNDEYKLGIKVGITSEYKNYRNNQKSVVSQVSFTPKRFTQFYPKISTLLINSFKQLYKFEKNSKEISRNSLAAKKVVRTLHFSFHFVCVEFTETKLKKLSQCSNTRRKKGGVWDGIRHGCSIATILPSVRAHNTDATTIFASKREEQESKSVCCEEGRKSSRFLLPIAIRVERIARGLAATKMFRAARRVPSPQKKTTKSKKALVGHGL